MIFHTDSESDLKTTPNQIKLDFWKNWVKNRAAASAEGLLNTVFLLVPAHSASSASGPALLASVPYLYLTLPRGPRVLHICVFFLVNGAPRFSCAR